MAYRAGEPYARPCQTNRLRTDLKRTRPVNACGRVAFTRWNFGIGLVALASGETTRAS
jgi:hypothetical protein